jgi:hypothetical protein
LDASQGDVVRPSSGQSIRHELQYLLQFAKITACASKINGEIDNPRTQVTRRSNCGKAAGIRLQSSVVGWPIFLGASLHALVDLASRFPPSIIALYPS